MGNNIVTLGIGGRHVRVGKLVAEGGFAFIYEAETESEAAGTGPAYILKRMRVPKDHQELRAIAQHEQEVCGRLPPHPNVVAILGTTTMDVGPDWDYYILMEACRCSVADVVQDFYARKEYLPQRMVLRVLRDVVLGLEHLHEREPPLAHRDIKVENVLLDFAGGYRLCDFGSSTTTHHRVTETSTVPLIAEEISRNTTLAYRAPEQVDLYRQSPISEKVDIWAVGCMAYKLCYFRTPFEDKQGAVEKIGILNGIEALRLPPPHLRRSAFAMEPPFGDGLGDLMRVCMAQEPDARPSASLLLDMLGHWAAAGRLPFYEPPSSSVRSSPAATPFSTPPAPMTPVEMDDGRLASVPSRASPIRRLQSARSGSPILSPAGGALFRGDSQRRVESRRPQRLSSVPNVRSVGTLRQLDVARVHSDGSEWGQERRASYVSETVKTGVLGFFRGGKERQRWIIKATSVRPGPPKAKYVRRIIIAIWEDELPLPLLFTFLGLRPLRSHPVVAFKGLVLLLKILQSGPPHVLTQMAALLPNIEALCRYWTGQTHAEAPQLAAPVTPADLPTYDRHRPVPSSPVAPASTRGFPTSRTVVLNESGRPFPVILAKIAGLVARKLVFHDENPEFSPHYTDASPETRRAVPLLPPDHAPTVVATMLDLQGRLLDSLETTLSATTQRGDEALSKSAASMLLPLAEESFTLLSASHNLLAVESLLQRMHPKLDALLGSFRAQYTRLQAAYSRTAQHPQVRIFQRAPILLAFPPLDDPASLERYALPVAPPSVYASAATVHGSAERLDGLGHVGAVCIPLAPQARDIFLARGCSLRFQPKAGGVQTPRPPSPSARKALAKRLATVGLASGTPSARADEEEDDEDDDAHLAGILPIAATSNFADFEKGFAPAPEATNGAETPASDTGAMLIGFSSEQAFITEEETFTSHDVFFDAHRQTSRGRTRDGPFDPFGEGSLGATGDSAWTTLPTEAFGGEKPASDSGRAPDLGHLRQPSGRIAGLSPEPREGHARAPSGKLLDVAQLLSMEDSPPPSPSPAPPLPFSQSVGSGGSPDVRSTPPDNTPPEDILASLPQAGAPNPFDTDFTLASGSAEAQTWRSGTDEHVSIGAFVATAEDDAERRNAEDMHAWMDAMDPVEKERLSQIWGAARQAWRANMPPEVESALERCMAAFEDLESVMEFSDLRVTDVVGSGAFATVYKAHMRLPGAHPGAPPGSMLVAFKKLGTDNGQAMQVKTLTDFESEVDLLRRLNHPNIVRFIGTTVDPLGVVTELCSRGNLMVLLHNEHVALSWARKLAIVADTARGMEYLHAQTPAILHRDLKSLNILIDENWVTKVTDFGLSRFKADSTAGNMTGQTGTYHWMAPEVINAEKYDERADVYSFGIILWETYGRSIPYEGMSPVQIVAAVVARRERLPIPAGAPAAYAGLIEACWAHDPSGRPQFREVLGRVEAMQERHAKSHKLRDLGS